MGKPHPIELRERVQGEIASGHSRRAAAQRFKVSASFAVKLAARVARTGSAEPARQGRPPGNGKLAPHLPALLRWVEAEPDDHAGVGGQTVGREGREGTSGFAVTRPD